MNDKEVEHQNDGETFTFGIGNSNSKQDVKIVAVDAAGNELVEEVNDFLVTTNLIARWYNNTPVFYGSIGSVGGIAAIIATYYVLRNRKKTIDIVQNDDQSMGLRRVKHGDGSRCFIFLNEIPEPPVFSSIRWKSGTSKEGDS